MRALGAVVREPLGERERTALLAHPYDKDPELSWTAGSAPVLVYEGDIPAEVSALAEARRSHE